MHGYGVSVETASGWPCGSRKRRGTRVHQSRPRRPALGELVQIDGSPHRWFEDRGPYCTLIVFIDDATSRLMALRFAEALRPPKPTCKDPARVSGPVRPAGGPLFGQAQHLPGQSTGLRGPDSVPRALKTLDIQPIHANTPQAKGRVERANETLQDRLVKELRRGIDSIDQANAFLPEYMADHNRRFARPPHNPQDAQLHDAASLDLILSLHSTRKLSRNLTLRYQNREYQILNQGKGYRLRSSPVHRVRGLRRSRHPVVPGQDPDYRVLAESQAPVPLDDEKSLHRTVDSARPSAQTPQVQTLPRPPLEPLETPPLHSCSTSAPVTPRPSERRGVGAGGSGAAPWGSSLQGDCNGVRFATPHRLNVPVTQHLIIHSPPAWRSTPALAATPQRSSPGASRTWPLQGGVGTIPPVLDRSCRPCAGA